MKILVTGFDPFGGETINPAIESVKRLPDRIGNVEIIKLEIPTVIGKSVAMVKTAIGLHHPDVVLSIGQAGGRPDMTVERIGINIDDCRITDNEGNQPVDMKVAADGPAAYFATLPIKAMVENIKAHGIPASVSNSAGTFICNHVFYGVAHIVATQYPAMKSGFIHIPFLPQQVLNKPGMPSMTLDAIVQGLVCAIEAIAENQTDIKTTGGTVH